MHFHHSIQPLHLSPFNNQSIVAIPYLFSERLPISQSIDYQNTIFYVSIYLFVHSKIHSILLTTHAVSTNRLHPTFYVWRENVYWSYYIRYRHPQCSFRLLLGYCYISGQICLVKLPFQIRQVFYCLVLLWILFHTYNLSIV